MAELTESSRRTLPRGRNALDPELVAADQRCRLLEATKSLVVESGFSDMRVTDIVARAGVAKPRFYELFESKAGCFLALIDLHFAELTGGIAKRLDPAGTVEERIWQGMTALVELVREDRSRAQIIFVEGPAAGREALDRIGAGNDLLAAFYVSLREETRARDASIPPLSQTRASAIVGAISEAISADLRHGATLEPDALRDELVEIVTLIATGHPA